MSAHNPQACLRAASCKLRESTVSPSIIYAQMANDLNFIHRYLLFPSINKIRSGTERVRDTFCCCISIINNRLHNNSVKTHFCEVCFSFLHFGGGTRTMLLLANVCNTGSEGGRGGERAKRKS